MQKKEFDSVFKTKLESFEMPPDDTSWDAISHQMNKNRWWKRAAYFSATLLVLGVISQFFNKEKVSEKDSLVDSTQTNSTFVSPSSEETQVTPKTVPSTTDNIKNKPGTTTTISTSGSSKTKSPETNPLVQTPTPITPAKDSIPTTTTTAAKTDSVAAPKVVVVKKKKPVYIIQQDTIVKTDTLQVKKRAK